jgi:hypothetical protein
MTEKERQQVLIGLGIWRLELDPALGRRAKERKLIFDRPAKPGLLIRMLNRLNRPH